MTKPPEKIKLVEPSAEIVENAEEGLRLLKAFLRISDPDERMLVIDFAERLALQKPPTTN
jgi:hypothetical protein